MKRVGFLVTSPYQVHHYKHIARFIDDVVVLIEVRDRDFGVREEFVRSEMPDRRIEWVPQDQLEALDGRFDAIICQTPILPLRFLERTTVIAQQYSLAKERYQYGLWRAQADTNLMYGPYSVERVSSFAHASAVGNPLLDPLFDQAHPGPSSETSSDGLRILYAPTYGDLASTPPILPRLGAVDGEMLVKGHQADARDFDDLPSNCRLVPSEVDPAEVLTTVDAMVTDFSGAAFDALAARVPVLLVGTPNPSSSDYHRLSEADKLRTPLAEAAVKWELDEPLEHALEGARERLMDDGLYERFLETYFVNLGSAGKACAAAIIDVIENGTQTDFAREQVRDGLRRYIVQNRQLRSELEPVHEKVEKLKLANSELVRKTKTLQARVNLLRSQATTEADLPLTVRLENRLPRFAPIKRWLAQFWILRWLVQAFRTRSLRVTVPAPPAVRAAPDESSEAVPDPASLGISPSERRTRMAQVLGQWLAGSSVPHRTATLEDRPILAVHHREKRKLFNSLPELVRAWPGLRVEGGKGSLVLYELDARDLTFGELYPSDWMKLGVPLRVRNYEVESDGYAELHFVEEEPEGRIITMSPRAPKVDWTRSFGPDDILEGESGVEDGERDAIGDVDLVYTWVDGSDPEWQRSFSRYADEEDERLTSADNQERFVDREELRYSLRSVTLFAPFFRKIYVVTADQRPSWLASGDSRIEFVSHSEIFPDPSVLPTFNSHAIESCLHRIPDLSERFVYMNDDVFLGTESWKKDFFTTRGLMKVRFSPSQYIYEGAPPPHAIPTDWAAYNSAGMVRRDFDIFFDRKLMHVPFPLLRDMMYELEDRYPDAFHRTRRSRFRSREDVSVATMLAPFYAVATGRGVEWPSPGQYVYADTGRFDWRTRFDRIRDRRPLFFCLNVTRYPHVGLAEQAQNVRGFLEGLYPFPSPFEVSGTDRPAGSS